MKNSYNKSKSFGKNTFRSGSGPKKPSGKPTAPKRRSDERAFESRYKSTESKAFRSKGGSSGKSSSSYAKSSESRFESRPRPSGDRDFQPRGGSSEKSFSSSGRSSERSFESRPRPSGGRDFKPKGGSSSRGSSPHQRMTDRDFEMRRKSGIGKDYKPRIGSSDRDFEPRRRSPEESGFKQRGPLSKRDFEPRRRSDEERETRPRGGSSERSGAPRGRTSDRNFEPRHRSDEEREYKPRRESSERSRAPRGRTSDRDFEPRRRSDEEREYKPRRESSEKSSAPRERTSDRDFKPRSSRKTEDKEFRPRGGSSDRSSTQHERHSDRDFEPRRRPSDDRDSKTRNRTPEKGSSTNDKPKVGRDFEITKRGYKTTGFKKRPSPKIDTRSKALVKDEIIKKENLFDINEGLRLNRYIAECGIAARRKADDLITSGVVKINGFVIKELGTKVMPGDFVTVNGDPIWLERHFEYILLNKPKGVITTTSDEKNRATVMDLIKRYGRVYPVGRLDRNTTGVLLLTNDGELAYRLTHPKYEIERIYNVKLDKELKQPDAEKIAKGVMIDGAKTAPCQVMMYTDASDRCTLTLTEGRNHEVKKLFEAVGYEVKTLDRKYFATLSTSGMKRGEYRNLTDAEVKEIKELVELI